MATPRHKLIDKVQPLHYHLTSRCVRRSFLCGYDKTTRKNYNHRKAWIEQRLLHLVPSFSLELDAYAIMANHLHLVIYYDPNANQHWSDHEVAERYTRAFPVRNRHGEIDLNATAIKRDAIALNPQTAARRRTMLGSVSEFMKALKQPIAYRANQEDGCAGHFFEQRFYSGAILDQDGLITAMSYVDLNPVRAKVARSIEAAEHTSVHRRLKGFENTERRLTQALKPLASGLTNPPQRHVMTLKDYTAFLERRIEVERHPQRATAEDRVWAARIASIGKYQRAYGGEAVLNDWLSDRGFRALEKPLAAI